MKKTVLAGECLISISEETGIPKEKLYEINPELETSDNCLMPGQQIEIGEAEVEPITIQADEELELVVSSYYFTLKAKLLNEQGESISNTLVYLCSEALDEMQSATSDDNGIVLFEQVPIEVETGFLGYEVESCKKVVHFNVGNLRPFNSGEGKIQRLTNIGWVADPDGEVEALSDEMFDSDTHRDKYLRVGEK